MCCDDRYMVVTVASVDFALLAPQRVNIEVAGTNGLPTFHIIGLTSRVVNEARERISAALKHSGVRLKALRTTVNLSPADFPKQSSHFDLGIAVGLLTLYGVCRPPPKTGFLGELSLTGEVRPIKQCFALVAAAQELGFQRVVIPADNWQEVSTLQSTNCTLFPLHHLREISTPHSRFFEQKPRSIRPTSVTQEDTLAQHLFALVAPSVLRVLSIAAVGRHHLLLCGPPGVGKTTAVRLLPHLLPPLKPDEAKTVTQLHSQHEKTTQVITSPPLRSPHHHITTTGLLGGGLCRGGRGCGVLRHGSLPV
jgi:magnesium chelatase family protein